MTRLVNAVRTFVAILREIFDESAYARFLRRKEMQSSKESYAAFCRERDGGKSRCPRCC